MRLLFFRHGDPNYEIDGLTAQGRIEAQLLSRQIRTFGIDEVYVSPLGRAAETAEYSLKELGVTATTLDWLKEFPALFDPNIANEKTREAFKNEIRRDPVSGEYSRRIVWDIMPSYYCDHPELFDASAWRSSELAAASDAVMVYDNIVREFDSFLSEHGYDRNGSIYSTQKGNDKVLAFFCHFGVTCVLLSHLWNVSPFVLLQSLAMAPASVTEVVTEEREKGIVIFRTLRVGDITHLTLGGEKPSFSARFCERFENEDERH